MKRQLLKWVLDLTSNLDHFWNIVAGVLYFGFWGIIVFLAAKIKKSIAVIIAILALFYFLGNAI